MLTYLYTSKNSVELLLHLDPLLPCKAHKFFLEKIKNKKKRKLKVMNHYPLQLDELTVRNLFISSYCPQNNSNAKKNSIFSLLVCFLQLINTSKHNKTHHRLSAKQVNMYINKTTRNWQKQNAKLLVENGWGKKTKNTTQPLPE